MINMKNKFRVVYETLSGATKSLTVEARTEEDAVEYIVNHYPDVFQILTVI